MCPDQEDQGKIDLHTHIIPKTWPDWNREFGNNIWVTIKHESDRAHLINPDGSVFRRIAPNCWCPKIRLEECDRVLSTVPGIGFNYRAPAHQAHIVAKYLNNHIHQVIKDGPPGRFIGLGTVPLQDPSLSIVELERCVKELGFAGIQIGSHMNGFSLDDPQLEPLWEAVEKLDCAVFVHPWDMSTDSRVQKYWFPWLLGMPHETAIAMGSLLLGGVLERHPRLRICFAHGGGCFPTLIGRISHGFHARPDLCQIGTSIDPALSLKKIYVDSLVHDEDVLKVLIKKLGEDRIILGSDYPFPLGEIDRPGKLVERLDSNSIKEKILWHNALQFLYGSETKSIKKRTS